jgi:hypothetical protein
VAGVPSFSTPHSVKIKPRAEQAAEKDPAPRQIVTEDVTTVVTSSSCAADGVRQLLLTTVFLKVFKKPEKQLMVKLSKLMGKVEGSCESMLFMASMMTCLLAS